MVRISPRIDSILDTLFVRLSDVYTRYIRPHLFHGDKLRYVRDASLIVLIIAVLVTVFKVNAATYQFAQSSWSGGADAVSTASHGSNRTNWTKYESATGVTTNSTVSLPFTNVAAVDDSAGLTALATPTIGAGTNPYGIAISPDGTSVYSTRSNTGNNVYMFSRNTSTGALAPLATPTLSSGSDAYAAAVSPDGTSVYVTNYTNATLSMYSRNTSTGALTALATPTIAAGAGANSVIVSPDGASVYVTNYNNNTVSMYSRNISTGALTPLATPTIATGNTPQDMAISPDGTSVYVTNVGNGSVSMYSRNTSTGALAPLATPTIAASSQPRGIAISPDGASVYVATYGSNTVSMYSRNTSTGALTALATPTIAAASSWGIAVSPDGASVFVTSLGGNILMFSRNISTGALTAFATPAIAAGSSPRGIVFSADGTSVYTTNNSSSNISMYRRPISGGTQGFESGTNSSTVISGSGASASITLNGIGAVSGTVVGTYAVGTNPYAVTYDSTQNAIWTANNGSNNSTKLNASTGALIGSYGSLALPRDIVYDPTQNVIWLAAAGNSFTSKINASTGATINSYALGTNLGIAYDSIQNVIWNTHGTNGVTKANAVNGALITNLNSYQTVGGVAFDATQNAVWVAINSAVVKINASSTTNISTTTISGANRLAYDSTQNAVWVTTAANNTVVKVNASTGSIIGTYSVGAGAEGVAFDVTQNAIWVANSGTTTVTKLNASTGALIGTYTVGSSPRGVVFDPAQNAAWVANFSSNTVTKLSSGFLYPSSGTFTSGVIDTSTLSNFTTISYTATTPAGTGVTVDVRAGNTATADGTWTSWQTGIASGGSISSLSGNRYVQYRLNLSTSNTSVTPSVGDVTINYQYYGASGTLISSAFDSSSSGNIMGSVAWEASIPSGTTIKFQIRTAPDAAGSPGTWTGWMGPDGTASTYFTDSTGGEIMPAVLRDATDDQWFQYKAFLSQTSGTVPTLSGVTVTYVVNAPPEFDESFGTNGVTALQIATSTDENWGKVSIQYRVRDPDGSTGSETPGYITPSFEYNVGGGWVAIDAGNLSALATANKEVGEINYSTYDAVFDIAAVFPDTYSTIAQIRVKANDNEGANNITYATSSTFTLDTRIPAVSAFHIDGTSATFTVTFAASDDTGIREYVLSNNADFSADGVNVSSGIAQAVDDTSVSVATAWTLAGTSTKVVYLKLTDVRGNVKTQSVVVPATPSNVEFRDISNVDMDSYREFIAWNLYPDPAPEGAPFTAYHLYASDNGTDFSLLYTSTNPTINYFIDTPVSTSTTRYYKVAFVTGNGDKTLFSPTVSDIPDGRGGTNNGAIPIITNVQVTDVKNTSAKVTWTTDDLALSEVDYGTTNAYGQVKQSRSYVTDHGVYLTGLLPDTTYYYRVRSIDAYSGTATNNNNGAGYTFTTGGGPVISNVTVSTLSDNSATVSWNTSVSSDSYVDYSTSPTLASYTETGSAALVEGADGVYQHRVTLTGLVAGTTYYFQVKSTDMDQNIVIDTNNDSYYTFLTTYDAKPPVISEVASPVISAFGAVVTWRTDELATTQVEYGTTASTTSGQYASETVALSTPTIFHSMTLSGETAKLGGGMNFLQKRTKYYYRVRSTDQAGNTTVSPEYDFTTTEDGAVNATFGGGGQETDKLDTKRAEISVVKVANITPFGAVVSFTTNEETRGIVQYGETTTYSGAVGVPVFTTSHSVQLKGLRMGTTYNLSVNVVDRGGNVTQSSNQTFKTTSLAQNLGNLLSMDTTVDELSEKIEDLVESALPSINPPFIEKPAVESVGEDFATVSWRTNVKAYGSVVYAEDSEFAKDGLYTTEQTKTDQKVTEHSMELSNLKPNTKYHFKAKSYVFLGAAAQTDDMTFVTKAGKVQAQVRDRKKDSMKIVWDTMQPTTSIVTYKVRGSQQAARKTDDSLTTSHEIFLQNLLPATTYEIRAYGLTADGNMVEAKNTITASTNEDVAAPIITNFKVDSALVPGRTDRTQTIVSWKTDEPATSVVYYEEGSGSATAKLSQQKDNGSEYTDNHVVILTNLKPGTIYRFQIISTDDANNMARLPVRTIVTPSQSESVVDVIFKNFDDTFKFMRTVR